MYAVDHTEHSPGFVFTCVVRHFFPISTYHIIDNNNIAHNATIDNVLN